MIKDESKKLVLSLRVYSDEDGKMTGEADHISKLKDKEYQQLKRLIRSFELTLDRDDGLFNDDSLMDEELPLREAVKTDRETTGYLLKEYFDYNQRLEHILNRQSTMIKEMLSMLVDTGKIVTPRQSYWSRYGKSDWE
jgi:hypothetical protein